MCIMQGACVQNVLDSLVPALLADKNRKFIYVEQAGLMLSFYLWWRSEKTLKMKTTEMSFFLILSADFLNPNG